MFKKLLCVALIVCMLFTGCGDKNIDEVNNSNIPKGRYVEEILDVCEEDDFIRGIAKDNDGNIQIFATPDNRNMSSYTLKNGSWEKKSENWFNNAINSLQEPIVGPTEVVKGEDGNYYGYYSVGEDYKSILVKSSDGENFERINIPYLEIEQGIEGHKYYPAITNIAVNKNGDILAEMYSTIKVFKADGSDYGYELRGESIAITDDKFAVLGEDRTDISVYNILTGMQIQKIPLSKRQFDISMILDEDGTIYMLDSDGINRLVGGGSTWEIIVDGSLNSLSMPSLYGKEIIKGNNNDYYVTAISDEKQNIVMHYFYDENIPSSPSEELSIYSLEDKSTIRQAIVEFQRDNPDVRVNFRVAMDTGGNATKSDIIRALNTELLANKGADILILDGMPIESYIEKNVLADISDIINPMIESGQILENVVKNYKIDDKIYMIPARLNLPVYIGNEEALSNTGSLEELANYSQNISLPLFGQTTRDFMLKQMFNLEFDKLVDKNNGINIDEYAKFLENIKKIDENMKYRDISQFNVADLANMGLDLDGISDQTEFDILDEYCQMYYNNITGLSNSMFPLAVMDSIGANIKLAQDTFVPNIMIGLNSKSENQVLARKFIITMLSESIQKTDFYEGFPVNVKALDSWITLEKDSGVSISTASDKGSFTADWPVEEKRKMLVDMCKNAKKPLKTDEILLEMIVSESKNFFDNGKTAQEVAQITADKTKTYLSE